MIFYFSGTGNSRFAAQEIGEITGEEAVSINEMLKSETDGVFDSEKPLVFVCPTYAWRIPRVVEEHLRKCTFSGSKKAYFVLTCGDDTGDAAYYAEKLCKEKGLEYMGLKTVVMPENYIAMFKAPDKAQAEKIIEKALPGIVEAAELIKEQRPLTRETIGVLDKLKSRVVNPLFYLGVSAKGFYSTDACTGCGSCAELCPLNNIKLDRGRPVWGEHCTHCMACICRCPAEAIEYKNKSKGQPRYHI